MFNKKMVIWNFICKVCGKPKSHGKPDDDGRWICLDCLYFKDLEYNDKKVWVKER